MKSAQHKIDVGVRLRLAIEALGLSQVEVAGTLQVSPSKLGNWVRGDNYPDEFFVYRFWQRYGITADWLYLGQASGLRRDVADILYTMEQAVGAVAPE